MPPYSSVCWRNENKSQDHILNSTSSRAFVLYTRSWRRSVNDLIGARNTPGYDHHTVANGDICLSKIQLSLRDRQGKPIDMLPIARLLMMTIDRLNVLDSLNTGDERWIPMRRRPAELMAYNNKNISQQVSKWNSIRIQEIANAWTINRVDTIDRQKIIDMLTMDGQREGVSIVVVSVLYYGYQAVLIAVSASTSATGKLDYNSSDRSYLIISVPTFQLQPDQMMINFPVAALLSG